MYATIEINNGTYENLKSHAHEHRVSDHKLMTHTVVDRFEPITFQVTAMLM